MVRIHSLYFLGNVISHKSDAENGLQYFDLFFQLDFDLFLKLDCDLFLVGL